MMHIYGEHEVFDQVTQTVTEVSVHQKAGSCHGLN